MAETIHPFYEQHRGAMEAAMRDRLDLAEVMLCERAHLTDIAGIRQEVMNEFEIVLTQMTYVGGAASRMSDFFMRLMGFMAISRVLRRHGVPLSVIGDIERESYKAQLLTLPEAKRLASGRQFMSSENQTLLREQATRSMTENHQNEFPEDFVYDFVEPARVTRSNSASTTRPAASANSRRAMATRRSCRTFAGSISTPMQREASTWRGRKHWLAARAIAISDSRDLRLTKTTYVCASGQSTNDICRRAGRAVCIGPVATELCVSAKYRDVPQGAIECLESTEAASEFGCHGLGHTSCPEESR